MSEKSVPFSDPASAPPNFKVSLAAIGIFCRTLRNALDSRVMSNIVLALCLGLISLYIVIMIVHIIYPNYFDHVEPGVAAISWLATSGHPMYPLPQTGTLYEAPYGPLLFFVDGMILHLYPSIVGSKVAGLAIFISAMLLIYVALNNTLHSDRKVVLYYWLICIMLFCSLSINQSDQYVISNRPEPFLLLFVALTVIAVQRLPPWAAAIAIGVLAGLASDTKLTGALYALPAAFAVYGAKETWKDRIGLAVLTTVGAAVTAILPLTLNLWGGGTSSEGYISVLLMTSKHGLSLSSREFQNSAIFALLLLSPIVSILYFVRPKICGSDRWFLVGLAFSLFLAVAVASKPGAGSHHIIPLIPLSLYSLASVATAPSAKYNGDINSGHIVMIFAISLISISIVRELPAAKNLGSFVTGYSVENKKIDELLELNKQFPTGEVGVSDQKHYNDTFYRAFITFHGAMVHVDFSSWMDFQFANYSDNGLVDLLKRCEVPVWILPNGEPFTLNSAYTGLPLISERFRGIFHSNYTLIKEGVFYQVWKCKDQFD